MADGERLPPHLIAALREAHGEIRDAERAVYRAINRDDPFQIAAAIKHLRAAFERLATPPETLPDVHDRRTDPDTRTFSHG